MDLISLLKSVPADEWIPRMRQLCDFLDKANKKLDAVFPGRKVEIIGGGAFQTLKDEAVETTMVTGRSASFIDENTGRVKDEEVERVKAITAEIKSIQRRFSVDRTVFIGGGTESGDIGLYHKLATEHGFIMVGAMPITGVEKNEPALMTHLYIEPGLGFGKESNTIVNAATSILMLGGGKQAAREAIKGAFHDNKPVYIVANDRFGGKSAEVAEALKDFRNVKVFESGAVAADSIAKIEESTLLSRLPSGGFDSTIKDFLETYHDQFKLAFSTWSRDSPGEKIETEFAKFVRETLSRLDPKKVIIGVAGTLGGGEGKYVIPIAKELGFNLYATPAQSVKAEELSHDISLFIETGKTWSTRNIHFIQTFDAVITAGKSSTILSHIESAYGAGKQVFNYAGISSAIDTFANNLGTSLNYSENAAELVSKAIISKYPCNQLLQEVKK